jgi:hypothetical protein
MGDEVEFQKDLTENPGGRKALWGFFIQGKRMNGGMEMNRYSYFPRMRWGFLLDGARLLQVKFYSDL